MTDLGQQIVMVLAMCLSGVATGASIICVMLLNAAKAKEESPQTVEEDPADWWKRGSK